MPCHIIDDISDSVNNESIKFLFLHSNIGQNLHIFNLLCCYQIGFEISIPHKAVFLRKLFFLQGIWESNSAALSRNSIFISIIRKKKKKGRLEIEVVEKTEKFNLFSVSIFFFFFFMGILMVPVPCISSSIFRNSLIILSNWIFPNKSVW